MRLLAGRHLTDNQKEAGLKNEQKIGCIKPRTAQIMKAVIGGLHSFHTSVNFISGD